MIIMAFRIISRRNLAISCVEKFYITNALNLCGASFAWLTEVPVRTESTFPHFIPNTEVLNRDKVGSIFTRSTQIRGKTSRKDRKEYEVEDSDDEEIENIPGSKVIKVSVDSLRSIAVLKHGLGIPRNKLDVYYYEGRIRVNGRNIAKKSYSVSVGDEIDVIKGFNDDNPEFINVSRVEVIAARPTGDLILLTLRKSKSLLVENYEIDPWKESSAEPAPEKDVTE